MKDYNLSDKQEEEFQKLVEEKQQLILEAGEIKKDYFDKFSF